MNDIYVSDLTLTTEDIVLRQIRLTIRQMSDESQIRVEAIAATLRNILKADPEHATMAFALVGAEQAAST